jgi:hypothetical protein
MYYYIFAVSKIDNSMIIPNVKDKKLLDKDIHNN